MNDILIMVLSTIGAVFILIASFGIYKMPDFYSRLSVTIKAATLGIGCILIASILYFSDFSVTTKAIAIIFFLFITSPVAGFLIGKVAYITGTRLWEHSILDEMKGDPDSNCSVQPVSKRKTGLDKGLGYNEQTTEEIKQEKEAQKEIRMKEDLSDPTSEPDNDKEQKK